MSLPRYREYRDSGTWLGKIPSGWEVMRLMRVASVNDDVLTESTDADFELEYVDIGSVSLGRGIERTERLKFSDAPSRARRLVRDGDILVSTVRTYLKAIAPVVMPPTNLVVSTGFAVVRPAVKLVSKYAKYALQATGFVDEVISRSTGVSYPAINASDLVRIYIPVPPPSEQTAVAAFLDRETAKIDALIAEQEKLIGLLAEKRQATISHAVTKGINPNARLKDSGVAWLGNVPAHWNVLRIKQVISSIEQGWSPQCENFPVNSAEEWGVLKVGCVNGGRFQPAENKKLPSELEPVPAYSLKRGDLLISRANTRDLVGSAAAVETDFEKLMLCDKLYRLRLVEGFCFPSHLAAYLGTPQARSQIELEATGASSSMLNIGQSAILDLVVPLPSVSEQRAIQQFLDNETGLLDALNTKAQEAILLLNERRGALIAAAVTGQIDVRGTISQVAAERLEAIAA